MTDRVESTQRRTRKGRGRKKKSQLVEDAGSYIQTDSFLLEMKHSRYILRGEDLLEMN